METVPFDASTDAFLIPRRDSNPPSGRSTNGIPLIAHPETVIISEFMLMIAAGAVWFFDRL